MPVQPKPYLPEAPAGQTPAPCVITPALLKQHSITPAEYESLHAKLGRTPSLTELGIFSVMWSEHCSYKSSRVHLKRLPTKGDRLTGPGSVVQGPGENAGIIDVGDGWACAFKIESHNHPSYIEPYQGAATGVGGILRDIFTMNARPMAIMDSIRFGPIAPEGPAKRNQGSGPRAQGSANQDDPATHSEASEQTSPSAALNPEPSTLDPVFARNRHTLTGVVHGIAGYGNCFGVPNLGGETRFEPCYSGNPLVSAFALGLVRKDEIFYARATGVGNPVIYVGAKTGRDGIHGATMASEEFTEGSEQKRPNVQMGDPFLEKLLLEACLEAMATGAVLGIQDMGAAGLTCSTCEMGARGELGVSIELDRVPQRETGMTSYEIMLSESQERMLLVAEAGREHEVLAVFAKWGLDAAIVGEVTADDTMRVFHAGVLIAEIPNKALTDEAPVYHRPVGTWTPPVPKDPPVWVIEELKKPRDYTADLKKLLASPNICSKHWIYEQYDSMVQTNTVQGPGGEAGVIRIKGTGKQGTGTGKQGTGNREQGSGGVSEPRAPSSGPDTAHPHAPARPDELSSFAEGGGPDCSKAPPPPPTAAHHHGILDTIANLVAASTPEGEATLATDNPEAANPVLAPDATHTSGTESPLNPEPWTLNPEAPERGLAMALAGNGRWCFLDPKLGAMHAVAEAARKVACTGATPVAATNCLNFGNPEKPEIMAQLSAAIDGIAEACKALGTPITGGNVSLYNETKGEGIYPTPVIGVVGILDDVTKAVPSAFQREGDTVLFLSAIRGAGRHALRDAGSTAWAQAVGLPLWGEPVVLDLTEEILLHRALAALASRGLLHSAADISDGGFLIAAAKAALAGNLGAELALFARDAEPFSCTEVLFSEIASSIVATCAPEQLNEVRTVLKSFPGTYAAPLGTVAGYSLQVGINGQIAVDVSLTELRSVFQATLEFYLAAEVLT